jgi:hypothetical protein
MPARRFPPTWSIKEEPECFIVRDTASSKHPIRFWGDRPSEAVFLYVFALHCVRLHLALTTDIVLQPNVGA